MGSHAQIDRVLKALEAHPEVLYGVLKRLVKRGGLGETVVGPWQPGEQVRSLAGEVRVQLGGQIVGQVWEAGGVWYWRAVLHRKQGHSAFMDTKNAAKSKADGKAQVERELDLRGFVLTGVDDE